MRKTALFLLITILFSIGMPADAGNAAQTRVIRVGFYSMDGYHMIDDEGILSGYDYEYLQKLALFNNWVYEFVGYDKSWDEMMIMLEKGEIDLLSPGYKTQQMTDRFSFSEKSMGSSSTILSVQTGNDTYIAEDYASYHGIRIGFIAGSRNEQAMETFAKEKGFTCQMVSYETEEAMKNALILGEEIDAIVSSSMRVAENETILAEFNTTPFYILMQKGNTLLLNEVNDAMEKTSVFYTGLHAELYSKYFKSTTNTSLAFTADELEYIERMQQDGSIITAAMKPEYLPLSGFKEGEAQGIIADIAAYIEEETGLSIDILETQNRQEYSELCQSGQVTLILDCVSGYGEAEKYNAKLTKTYLTVPYASITIKNDRSIEKVGALKGAMISQHYLPQIYSADQIVLFDSNEECVAALKEGTVDICYQNLYTAEQIVQNDVKNQLTDEFYDQFSISIGVAVKNTADEKLLSIINKVMYGFDQSTLDAIISKNTVNKSEAFSLTGYIYTHPFSLGILFVFLLFIVIAEELIRYNSKKGRMYAEMNREYAQLISYVCSVNDEVSEVNISAGKKKKYSVEAGVVLRKETEIEEEFLLDDIFQEDRKNAELAFSAQAVSLMVLEEQKGYFEFRTKTEKGDYRWFAYILQGIPRDENHPNNYMLFKRNIDAAKTEEEQKRSQLLDALALAEQASEAKGVFMSRMSHEIRTPLNGVIGYMAIAQNSMGNEDRVRDYIEKAEMAARHLLAIINDVLDMSAIESGKMKVAYETFDFKQVASSISTLFYHQAEQKGIHYEAVLKDITEEKLIGDPMRLNQILMNLLSNAIKFTAAGGRVTLSITQTVKQADAVYMKFSVEDSGIGMTEEYMKKLFQPFEQQDAEIAQKYGGTGLGLSITKNLVTMMKGVIKVESEYGKGSRFTVDLPFGVVHQTGSEITVQKEFSKVHALIVDDEANTCEYIKMMMDRCGVRTDTSVSGEKAIDMIKEATGKGDEYNLCLIDWKMPDMDGLEVVGKIREVMGEKIPIIIVTAYDFSEIEEAARKCGVNMIVSKPLFQSSVFDLLVNQYGKYKVTVPETVSTYDFQGTKVLLAEDNAMNMEIASEILMEAGFIVDGAKDGKEAMERFLASEKGTYQAILMDVQMPRLNGYEATKAIRTSAHPEAITIPILAMTANVFAEEVAKAIESGMNDHIAKPIDAEILFAVLAKHLKMKNE